MLLKPWHGEEDQRRAESQRRSRMKTWGGVALKRQGEGGVRGRKREVSAPLRGKGLRALNKYKNIHI